MAIKTPWRQSNLLRQNSSLKHKQKSKIDVLSQEQSIHSFTKITNQDRRSRQLNKASTMEKTADDNIEITQPSSEQSEKDEDDEVKGGEEHEDDEEDDALSYDPGETPMGCCIFGKYPMTALFGFVFLGLLVGIGLSYWRPEVRCTIVQEPLRLFSTYSYLYGCTTVGFMHLFPYSFFYTFVLSIS